MPEPTGWILLTAVSNLKVSDQDRVAALRYTFQDTCCRIKRRTWKGSFSPHNHLKSNRFLKRMIIKGVA